MIVTTRTMTTIKIDALIVIKMGQKSALFSVQIIGEGFCFM